ncbi:hypothetical protein [Actinoplanes solisilvae]|uniref:hypothetical protein n=1 Tax=Actinoplanes solisilvae TaxID=2486853 RepID=UPI000FD873EE|nr:hypothetical protein [Actinoplanes solisilvae]
MAVDANTPAPYVDRRLALSSVALLGAAWLAGMAGAAIGVLVVVQASRRYVADLAEPPRVTAGRRWQQARSATAAGIGAWQEHSRPEATR